MALQRLLRRDEPVQPAKAPSDSHEEELGFPSWVIPSIAHFLRPFWGMTASYDPSFPSRDFVREAGIHLRLDLDWSGGHDRAGQSLWAATYRDPERLRRLVDFASGLVYGLDGKIELVANRVYLLTPADVEVSAEERERLAGGGFYNQF